MLHTGNFVRTDFKKLEETLVLAPLNQGHLIELS